MYSNHRSPANKAGRRLPKADDELLPLRMIKSMTGYGLGAKDNQKVKYTVEINP